MAFKFKVGTKVQGAEYMQGNLIQIAEGKITKRKRWSSETISIRVSCGDLDR